MAAAIHDIVIEKESNFVLGITWYDKNGNTEDVSAYGAEFRLGYSKENDSTPFVVVTHTSSTDGQILISENPGEFLIQINWETLKGIPFERGYWQLDVFPIAEDPDTMRQRLGKGKVYVDNSL